MAFAYKIARTHSNRTKFLTFVKHKAQKRCEPKIVRTVDYDCAYVLVIAILIIFPVILQTVINLIMLSIGGQG